MPANIVADAELVDVSLQEPAQPRRGDVDMEVTFTPGLEGLGARLLAQSRDQAARKDETVWQSYLRRQK